MVHAAAGGVGPVAVQLAGEWGATVIGTASPGNHAYLTSLGITPVAYGPVGSRRDRNRIGTIADFMAVQKYGVRRPGGRRSAGDLRELVHAHTAGRLQLPVHAAVPLGRAADAHREVETGHVRGKVVLLGTDGCVGS